MTVKINRWILAVGISFSFHAVLGWYITAKRLDADSLAPAKGQVTQLSLGAFKSPEKSQGLPNQENATISKVPKVAPPPADLPVIKEPSLNRIAKHELADQTKPIEAVPTPSKEWVDSSIVKNDHIAESKEILDERPAPSLSKENPERFTENGVLIITDPVFLKRVEPVYPRQAVKRQQQGTVIVDATLNETGYVVEIKIFESSGFPLLDHAALKSVKNWQFEPANHNGAAVISVVRIPVDFILN